MFPGSTRQDSLFALGRDTRLFRLHSERLAGNQFNPGLGSSRFAPFKNDDGKVVPTLYAATTFDGAAYETLFRERPAKYQTFPRQKLYDRAASELTTTREIRLVSLFTPELTAWGINEADLFNFDESQYPCCRLLAARIWKENLGAGGMIWSSVRDSASNGMMFFQDRIEPDFLHVDETRFVCSNADLLDDLRTTAARAGITISL